MSPAKFVLTVSCPETQGIVRAVSNFLYESDATIAEAAEHRDAILNRFFMRVEFEGAGGKGVEIAALKSRFAEIAAEFSMDWHIHAMDNPVRLLLAVSKHGHCLNDILHRWDNGQIPAQVVGVISNHEDMRSITEWYNLPFHYLPITKDNKSEQEARILQIVKQEQVDLFALARYMQILSPVICNEMTGRIINIHHSFLPGFKGANPYRQAYDRGVKIIGATAHYVTADLDGGPIIEQAVEKVDTNADLDGLVQMGRDTECVAFARAIKWHCEHRIIINGIRTIVFK